MLVYSVPCHVWKQVCADKNMLVFTLILLFANALALVPRTSKPLYSLDDHDLEQLFEEFIVKHDKLYDNPEEKQNRLGIFKENVEKINKRNSDPDETATFDINRFSDLTLKEFKQKYTGFKPQRLIPGNHVTFINASDATLDSLPESFDWRTRNAVTSVKDQGPCASCWTFSTTGAIEGAFGIKHGKAESFSESQLVDCDRSKGDNGCYGGFMQNAIKYLINAGGQMSAADYPYVPKRHDCKFDKSKVAVRVTNLLAYSLRGEDDTKTYLVQNGPVAIAVDTTDWVLYRSGILRTCTFATLDHAVLLVGYGQENGQKYYIIKNSYGTTWGEQGYIRVEISGNPCKMYNDYAAGAQVA